MIQRVAKSIYLHEYGKRGGRWDAVEEKDRISVWYPKARTAIEAMMEPTHRMVQHGMGPMSSTSEEQAARTWYGMIDEALETRK